MFLKFLKYIVWLAWFRCSFYQLNLLLLQGHCKSRPNGPCRIQPEIFYVYLCYGLLSRIVAFLRINSLYLIDSQKEIFFPHFYLCFLCKFNASPLFSYLLFEHCFVKEYMSIVFSFGAVMARGILIKFSISGCRWCNNWLWPKQGLWGETKHESLLAS